MDLFWLRPDRPDALVRAYLARLPSALVAGAMVDPGSWMVEDLRRITAAVEEVFGMARSRPFPHQVVYELVSFLGISNSEIHVRPGQSCFLAWFPQGPAPGPGILDRL